MANVRYKVLDGWRAIAILLVLSAHLLPLGPHFLRLNESVGIVGMALFFCLSGFLVTDTLISHPNIWNFLIRRLCRVLPLVWLYLLIVFCIYPMNGIDKLAHVFFYANYPPKPLVSLTDHLWSLCVEIHFYLGIFLLAGIFKKYWTILIPLLCVGFTILRIKNGIHYSVITHFRVDEILIGSVLALINRGLFINPKISSALALMFTIRLFNLILIFILFLLSCYIYSGFLNYFRPYLAAILIGITLFSAHPKLDSILSNQIMRYIGSISFSLYIIHPLLVHSWFGSGDIFEKYSKRPLLLIVLFLLAHGSTFYYEKRAISFGRRLSKSSFDKKSPSPDF